MKSSKLTINQLLELIDSLPPQEMDNPEIKKLKKTLLKIKFDDKNKGFCGNIVLENYLDLLKIIKY